MMAKTKESTSPKLILNDKEYDVINDLNDEQKVLYSHLKNIEDKLNNNNFIQQQLMVSKDGFVRLLEESFKPKDSEEEK
jgi:hypothetical protein|tara:strand:- start:3628 stop:3864 length:237 start_codon:yes stop_codon:yes gene_type:complete